MKTKLSSLETKVLNLIPKGMDNRKNLKDISLLVHVNGKPLSIRRTQDIINSLTNYGIPICSSRSHDKSGVYIAETKDEVILGVRSLKKQADEMKIRAKNVENADLDNWPLMIDKTYQVQLEV